MTQTNHSRSDHTDTPWQTCLGLRAGAIDGAASLIIMEVLIDALSRLPEGRGALAEACRSRALNRPDETMGATPIDIAADALALALIEAAGSIGTETPALGLA